MPIDIDNLNPATRFPYPLPKDYDADTPNDGPEEWVSIRVLNADKLREIDKLTTAARSMVDQPRKANGKIDRRAALQRIEYREVVNQDLRNELIWDETIDEIHIFDSHGGLIPSTKEMKIKLMGKDATFAMYLGECLEILTEDEKDRKERLIKNSPTP